MKLSKAQATVMEQAKKEIDYARTHDFLHWYARSTNRDLETDWDAYPNPYLSNESVLKETIEYASKADEGWHKRYEEQKEGVVLTMCNSRTLAKLEEMGLIEILHDSKGTSYGIDTVKVLNY